MMCDGSSMVCVCVVGVVGLEKEILCRFGVHRPRLYRIETRHREEERKGKERPMGHTYIHSTTERNIKAHTTSVSRNHSFILVHALLLLLDSLGLVLIPTSSLIMLTRFYRPAALQSYIAQARVIGNRVTRQRCLSSMSESASAGVPASTPSSSSASSNPTSAPIHTRQTQFNEASTPSSKPKRKQGKGVLIGLALFIGCGFTFPFWYHFYNAKAGNHYTASKPLTPQQVMRGAYLNTSTKDIGPDPTWHARHGIIPIEGEGKSEERAAELIQRRH